MRDLSLNAPCLFVIDMQEYFLNSKADAFLKNSSKIIPNINKLISAFRKHKLPIFYTRHAHKKNQPTYQMGNWWNQKLPWEDDWQSNLSPKIKPTKGEIILTKTHYSAFQKTDLEKILRKINVHEIIICGVMTHLCVETTARHSFILNFQPIIIEDACADENKKYHEASILNLSHGFAHICKTRKMLSLL